MDWNGCKSDDYGKELWDAVVVGTGMGGATLGHALASAGWSVLFIEKGRATFRDEAAFRGAYAEALLHSAPHVPTEESYLRAGRNPHTVLDASGRRAKRFVPLLGCGAGGSSALYGMALERFFPEDFRPRATFGDAPDATLPEAWPIAYAELKPYYEAAEQLYRVFGTRDPLRGEPDAPPLPAPPHMHPANSGLFEHLVRNGLHPYRLPMACDFARGDDRCQGMLDAQGARNDASTVCLQPALELFGARLLDRCEVLKLTATATRVEHLICRKDGAVFTLRTRCVVLGAGAFATPALLLQSARRFWPRGLANASGLVGRNLMRHFIDLYLLDTGDPSLPEGGLKQLAFNDGYASDGRKFGTVQSFGNLPPAWLMTEELVKECTEDGSVFRGPLRMAAPILRRVLERARRRLVLASILEDAPYEDNRVEPGTDITPWTIHYHLRDEAHARLCAFRSRTKRLLKPYRTWLVKQAENNRRLAHACGTCRFGTDPRTSVLDRDNRAHGIDNLYVVDASFFPSSGGTNPGLTIAANALRVASHLADRWDVSRKRGLRRKSSPLAWAPQETLS